ncbi:MAG: PadR family transcriptional regulator [Anaerolineaceae bacterium]
MTRRKLLAGEYVALGLLALRPMHGYEMICYIGNEGLDAICPLEQSTLYTYLRNVESRGLVTWTEERVGLRPPRKTYVLSDAGRVLINEWLRRPVDRMREVRSEFLLKLFFLDLLDKAALSALLKAQTAACERYLVDVREHAQPTSFGTLVALSKTSAAEATLSWLQSYAPSGCVAAGTDP